MYTLRWNKARDCRILTFTKKVEQELLDAHPMACNLFIAKLLDYLRVNAGVKCTARNGRGFRLDFDQEQRLASVLEKVNEANRATDYGQHRMIQWFTNGVRIEDVNIEELVPILNRFFSLICNAG